MTEDNNPPETLVELTASIVAAYVTKNHISVADLPDLIAATHSALAGPTAPAALSEPLTPAVPIKKSVTPDFLISLEDGKQYKSLRRHLSTRGMSPEEYRAKWGLSRDYPMVAANYAAERSAIAKKLGLGRKPGQPLTNQGKSAAKATPAKASAKPKGKPIKPSEETFS